MRVPPAIHADAPPVAHLSGHLVVAALVLLLTGFVPLANGMSAAAVHMMEPSDEQIEVLLDEAELGLGINLTAEGYRAWDAEIRDRGIYVLQSVTSFLAWGFMLLGSIRILNGHQRGLLEATLGIVLWLTGGWITELARSAVNVQGGPADTSNLNVQIFVSMIKIFLIAWLLILHYRHNLTPRLPVSHPR